MGNATSCGPSMIGGRVVKVLLTNGRSECYAGRVTATEIITENPGHFLCDSSTLEIGRRIQALASDEELKRQSLYFLLPMELLYSVLTCEEMRSLTTKALNRHGSSLQSLVKMFPLFVCESGAFPAESKNEEMAEKDNVEAVERVSEERSYSWRPALDTIIEY